VTSTLPALVRVIFVLACLVTLVEKVMLVLGVTMIAAPEMPPRRVMVWGLVAASSVMVTVVCEGPAIAVKLKSKPQVPTNGGMVFPEQVSVSFLFEKPVAPPFTATVPM